MVALFAYFTAHYLAYIVLTGAFAYIAYRAIIELGGLL